MKSQIIKDNLIEAKTHDHNCLKNIKEEIRLFCKGNYEDVFMRLGSIASTIRFNDGSHIDKEKNLGCDEYVRNKYGNVDRSRGNKKREGGIEFFYIAALKHLNCVPINQETLCYLQNDFEKLDSKINIIFDVENNILSYEEALKKYEKLECLKLKDFVKQNYSKFLISKMKEAINDPYLMRLNLDSRSDRYYLGRTFCVVGELSKNLISMLGEKGGGIFTLFKKIRDKNLAHTLTSMVEDFSDGQKSQLNYLINRIMFKNLQKELEKMGSDLQNFHVNEDELQNQYYNKLRKSIFDKYEENLESVCQQKNVIRNKKPKDVVRAVKTDKEILLIKIKSNIEKYNKNAKDSIKKILQRAIQDWNKLPEVKHIDTEHIPPKNFGDVLEAFKGGTEFLKDKFQKIENRSNDTTTNISIKSCDYVENDKQEAKEDSLKKKKQLQIRMSNLLEEMCYSHTIVIDEEIENKIKDHILKFSISKIGQFFRDIDDEHIEKLKIEETEHTKYVKKTITERNKQVHEIIDGETRLVKDFVLRNISSMIREIGDIMLLLFSEEVEKERFFKDKLFIELGKLDDVIDRNHFLAVNTGNEIIEMVNKAAEPKEFLEKCDEHICALSVLADSYRGKRKISMLKGDILEMEGYESLERDCREKILNSLLATVKIGMYDKKKFTEAYIKLANISPNFKMYLGRALENLFSFHKDDSDTQALIFHNIGSIIFEKEVPIMEKNFNAITSSNIEKIYLSVSCMWRAKDLWESIDNNLATIHYIRNLQVLSKAIFCSGKKSLIAYGKDCMIKARELLSIAPLRKKQPDFIAQNNLEEFYENKKKSLSLNSTKVEANKNIEGNEKYLRTASIISYFAKEHIISQFLIRDLPAISIIIEGYSSSIKKKKPADHWNFNIKNIFKNNPKNLEEFMQKILSSANISVEDIGNNTVNIFLENNGAVLAMNELKKSMSSSEGLTKL